MVDNYEGDIMKTIIMIKCFLKSVIESCINLSEHEVACLKLDSICHPKSSLRYQANNFSIAFHNLKISLLQVLL